MKYLKSFLESDMTAGSIYAYGPKLVAVNSQIFPQKERWSYKCEDCKFEFFTYNRVNCCEVCNSENINLIYTISEKD
jgi:hypothetical protein